MKTPRRSDWAAMVTCPVFPLLRISEKNFQKIELAKQSGKAAGSPGDRPRELSPGSSKPRGRGWRGRSWAYFGLSFPAAAAPTIATTVPIRSAAEAILAQAATKQRKVSQPAWLAIPAACSWSSKCACESSPRTGSCNVRTLGT
jgi:hypothetical protein